ncbi:hypothetical protein ACFFMN_22835 [Planobispora siamensis]|uniref:Uncharacterized protein n=1 Tax=Planobispora siamensis TaxID=936338 RepID=A0A8J3WMW2_9ACTN|nr:hypothetical protein [Planobispora siamensis]GIH95403.1 hypothetical protein Psi01_60330 [Planobispora siamensis]
MTFTMMQAPWPPEVVGRLNAYQAVGFFHPYTCGGNHDGTPPSLVATPEGWVCPDAGCTYTQDWAHTAHGDGRAAAEADILADMLGAGRATAGAAATAEQVATIVGSHRFSYANEHDLHIALAAILADSGFEVRQEVPLSTGGRIDLMTGTVGIEVKVNGRASEVMRQVARYAACPDITALVLITSRAAHRTLDRTIGTDGTVNGKPVTIVWISQVVG